MVGLSSLVQRKWPREGWAGGLRGRTLAITINYSDDRHPHLDYSTTRLGAVLVAQLG